MKKSKKPIITVITCCIIFLMVVASHAEVIFKKDGSLVKGVITRDAAKYIIIRKEDGSSEKVLRRDIMRILYTKLYMGKVFVRLTSGDVLEVYKVEEDSETYTFRKDLYKPEEFKVERDRVMFIARSNPTDLSAEAAETEIDLKWSPPFKPPKYYKIYLSGPDLDYHVVAETGDTEYEIENLKSNTTYRVKVTAIYKGGAESLPTDEVKIRTKNVPPSRPGNLMKSDTLEGTTLLSWDPSTDVDGQVVAYRVYAVKDDERSLLSKPKNTELTIKGGTKFDRLMITAVDDMGAESDEGVFPGPGVIDANYTVRFSGGIIYPMGTFSDLTEMGYGGSLHMVKHNIYTPGLELGISAGFYYMPGKKDIGTDIQSVEQVLFVPLLVNLGYRFGITDTIHVIPDISLGAAYVDMPYEHFNAANPENRQLRTLGSMMAAGLSVDFNISESFFIGLQSDYGLLITGNIFDYSFVRVEAAAGYRLL